MYRTDEEIAELAKVGLCPDEHEEYERRLSQLKQESNSAIADYLAPDLIEGND